MSDFAGYGFAVGSVRGQRSWAVDSLGRLTGVTVKAVWTPGENGATCNASGAYPSIVHAAARLAAGGFVSASLDPPRHASTDAPHDPASCSCGFYAYYAEQDNPYHNDAETVAGVVEGYGKTTLGDKGFRAQKARIVALYLPGRAASSTGMPQYRRWLGILASAFALIAVSAITNSAWIGAPALIAGLLTIGIAAWNLNDIRVARHLSQPVCQWSLLHRDGGCCTWPKTSARVMAARNSRGNGAPDNTALVERCALVRRNYPDVPIYTSKAAMLKDFPVDASPVPNLSPETAEDFWTRQVTR